MILRMDRPLSTKLRYRAEVAARQEEIVSTRFQVTIDCRNPDRLTHFWAEALRYQIEPPPAGFDSWKVYWRSIGVPEEELADMNEGSSVSVVDPDGVGPRIWFQPVPENKVVKNRVHLDLEVSGGRTVSMEVRKERVNAEADRLVRAGATKLRVLEQAGLDHYAVAMQDPEGNEFDLN